MKTDERKKNEPNRNRYTPSFLLLVKTATTTILYEVEEAQEKQNKSSEESHLVLIGCGDGIKEG